MLCSVTVFSIMEMKVKLCELFSPIFILFYLLNYNSYNKILH